ncbi:MAG TPA: hypothetical protein DCQ06_09860 [Myxococcales bacterium]|nr:hypothetical protein [Myxococcales bacterium]
MSTSPSFEPLQFDFMAPAEQLTRAQRLVTAHASRRSVRHFRPDPIDPALIERCIEVACTAPSGANKQPWTFCVVTDPDLKRAIRRAAEVQEQAFYGGRAPQVWLDDVRPLGTNGHKAFLEQAPALIVVFAQHGSPSGQRHYYVNESVGIALGFLISALHQCGLTVLTHTPSPMSFLREILGRPATERPFLLLPVGLPALDCEVPVLTRKALDEMIVTYPPKGALDE